MSLIVLETGVVSENDTTVEGGDNAGQRQR